MAAVERPECPAAPESGEPLPEWLTWRWRYGPIPPPWLERRLLAPPREPGDAPWPVGMPQPPGAIPPDVNDPVQAEAKSPIRPRVPLLYRLDFVLFGALFTVPSSLAVLFIFGRGLPWTTWVAYLLGGLLGLVGLSAFFLALTAPPPPESGEPAP